MEQGALVRDIVLYKLYKYLENQGCELSVGNKINPSKEPAYVKQVEQINYNKSIQAILSSERL